MVQIGKIPVESDTVSPLTNNLPIHSNRTYQQSGFSLGEMIERRNLIIQQLALKPKKANKPKEKTLNQIILETPSEELPSLLKKMGLLK